MKKNWPFHLECAVTEPITLYKALCGTIPEAWSPEQGRDWCVKVPAMCALYGRKHFWKAVIIHIVIHLGYFKNQFEPFEIWRGRINTHIYLNF